MKTDDSGANLRVKHMFQTNDGNGQDQVYIPDTLNVENLNKIVLKFENKHESKNTVLDSVKHMLEMSNNNPTSSILDFIDELKSSIQEEKQDLLMNEEKSLVNIEEVISKAEEDLRQKDQKSVLQELIHDINLVSTNQKVYNEEQFEDNIKELLNELEAEVDEDEEIEIVEVKEAINPQEVIENDEEEPRKKANKIKLYAFFLFVIMGLIVIYYLYRDMIF